MQRGPLLALPLVVVAPLIAGCALFDRSSSLEDALETMPRTVTRVTFVDRAGAERLGIDLVRGLEDAPFTADDVEWAVVGHEGADLARVWKVDEDVDLADVDAADASFVVVPDAHLVLAGALRDEVLSVVDDDQDSLVDSGSFDALVDSTDDVEVADLARGEAACSLGDARVSPEQAAASGLADLTPPDASGYFVHGDDGEVHAVMLFGDEEEADEAAGEREELLADGTSPVSRVPYSEFGSYDVESDGDQVRIDIDYDEPEVVAAVLRRRDYPTVCAPG